MTSTRLSYEELVYLCVSLTHAKEIYGLTPKSTEVQVNWEHIRKGLIEKGILIENEDALQINPLLAYMVSAIGSPKMFISFDKPGDKPGKTEDSVSHCFYLARHFAVGLVKDKNAENQYLLSSYNTPEEMYEAFDHIIQWEEDQLGSSEETAEFTLDEYETYLKTLRGHGRDEHDAILTEHGFSAECIEDVFDTLSQKKYWLTMVMLAFDPASVGGKHIVEQSVLFKGDKRLWSMEIGHERARLFCTNRKDMERKLEIIAALFKYF